MTRKVVRDDPVEEMGRDVLVRDGFGATSPGTRMVLCWLVWHLYKPVRNKTDPIYVSFSWEETISRIDLSDFSLCIVGYRRFWLKVADEESKCIPHEFSRLTGSGSVSLYSIFVILQVRLGTCQFPRFSAKNATVLCVSDYYLQIGFFKKPRLGVSHFTWRRPKTKTKTNKQKKKKRNWCVRPGVSCLVPGFSRHDRRANSTLSAGQRHVNHPPIDHPYKCHENTIYSRVPQLSKAPIPTSKWKYVPNLLQT